MRVIVPRTDVPPRPPLTRTLPSYAPLSLGPGPSLEPHALVKVGEQVPGPLKIITPGMTLAYMNQVNASVLSLDRDIEHFEASQPRPPKPDGEPPMDASPWDPEYQKWIAWLGEDSDFYFSWKAWRADWAAFYVSNSSGPAAWLSRGLVATYNRVDTFNTQLNDWRSRFASRGGKPSGGEVPDVTNDVISTQGIPWGTIAIVAGVGTAAYFAVPAILAARAARGAPASSP